jgi:hypothetical protein
MTSMPSSAVQIQTSPESVPSTPSWLGEVAIMANYLTQLGLLEKIVERVRFARARFGIYDTIDFLVVLIGYAISSEPTLERFYERVHPFAQTFMALFGREQLPSRSALSRFLGAIDQSALEALRNLFQEDLLSRPLTQSNQEQQAGLQDRCGHRWLVFDADGTRQAARQRALPRTEALPSGHRRLKWVCAPGYTGRKRGEVVRTRTVLLQAHTHQWLATFGNIGNGDYRGELLRVMAVLKAYASRAHLTLGSILLRLDGLYGDWAILIDLAKSGLCYLTRGKDYGLLDHPGVAARLAQPPDNVSTHPETGTARALFDLPKIKLAGTSLTTRLIVATHPAGPTKASIGITRQGVVYELFVTALPSDGFTAADVVELYLHRGAFETVLGDEDQEQCSDRWVSYSPVGQEMWQILSQWIWNLRLELGHCLHPTPLRVTEMAEARPSEQETQLGTDEQPRTNGQAETSPIESNSDQRSDGLLARENERALEQDSQRIEESPQFTKRRRAGKFALGDFEPQPDGSLRCPAHHPLYPTARREEPDGSVRVLYAARLPDCRECRLQDHCLLHGKASLGPRHVSVVIKPEVVSSVPLCPQEAPAQVGSSPILWTDWSRREPRRGLIRLLQTQTVTIRAVTPTVFEPPPASPLTRAQRAHWRLSWAQRLSRNVASPSAPHVHIQLFGIPTAFATAVGLAAA